MDAPAGTYDRKVTIQQASETQAETGEVSRSWTTFATRRAEVVELGGDELVQAQQVVQRVSHRVRLRWLDGVTAKMRLLYGARTLEVAAVRESIARQRELELLCTEAV